MSPFATPRPREAPYLTGMVVRRAGPRPAGLRRQGSRTESLLGGAVKAPSARSALPVALALLLAAAAAGCVSPDTEASPSLSERITADPLSLPWDVEAQVDWWEDVATGYPKHDSN